MSSIIEGYNYDIFISYRQKDNKGDRWVSEFVEALKTELESTFKEEISVYFDINPYDGLLETHDVDASLKDKLKCLVFIPIISRTYCDPRSFAWEHEFKAFAEQAANDQFGLKVNLPNGNVASRVLPVRIYDLDASDIRLCETVLGSVLRGIEFIYKSAGVNRPLRSKEEKPQNNLNNTLYRDQINKVSNAIKEILTAIGQYGQQPEEISKKVFKPVSVPLKSNRSKIIAGLIILIVLVALGYILIPTLFRPKVQLEKSIAVLPFINDSPDQENTYFINGIMDEILNNLQKIKDFRVLSRTSSEKYRGLTKFSIPEIAKALDANYIVEGSGQKYGNTFRLRVQLIAARNEKHLWAESFEQEIKEAKDIFKIQSQIAQAIATELRASITPEEKQSIDRIPTNNLEAYDLYLKGRENLFLYNITDNNQSLSRAEECFASACHYDTTFALAYAGLAGVYYWNHTNEYESYFANNYLDSVLILADRALLLDDRLAEGYLYRAWYYYNIGNTERAIKEFDKSIIYSPNSWEAYLYKGMRVYLRDLNNSDYVKGIEYLYKAARINHGKEFPGILTILGNAFGYYAGFPEEAKIYYQEAFKLNNDTTTYLYNLGSLELQYGDFENGIAKTLKAYEKSPSHWSLAQQYLYNGNYQEAYKYYLKYIENLKSEGQIPQRNQHLIGFVCWQNGHKKEAEYWFNEQKKLSLESIKLGRSYTTSVIFGSNGYYDLAGVYAFTGEKEKAYEILRTIERFPVFPLTIVDDIKKYNPLFNGIRNEPEFQRIVKTIESKYQAEHERVKKWMEEQEKSEWGTK
jgi:TolB-like protein